MHQPEGYLKPGEDNLVCTLEKKVTLWVDAVVTMLEQSLPGMHSEDWCHANHSRLLSTHVCP